MVHQIVFVLLLIVCFTFVSTEQQYKCSMLKPLRNVTIEQLQGEWVTVNELLFVNGVPKSASTGESLRPNICIRHQVKAVNTSSMLWEPIFSFYRGHESRGGQLVINRRPNGKWTVRSDDGRPGGRMLVLAAVPDTYIVRATCVPAGQPKKLLVLKSVSVESRRMEGLEKRGALQAEELVQVKQHVANILGFGFKPIHYGFYC